MLTCLIVSRATNYANRPKAKFTENKAMVELTIAVEMYQIETWQAFNVKYF